MTRKPRVSIGYSSAKLKLVKFLPVPSFALFTSAMPQRNSAQSQQSYTIPASYTSELVARMAAVYKIGTRSRPVRLIEYIYHRLIRIILTDTNSMVEARRLKDFRLIHPALDLETQLMNAFSL